MFIDGQAAVESPIASLVAEYPIRSMNVIAHIRKATKGKVALVNTPDDRVAVIATEPLTDKEAWTSFAPGELLVFHHGAPCSA